MDLISKKDLLQEQRAGDNSNQIMVRGDINMGITESQARDICKAECAIALQNWAFQAGAFAESRIQKLEDKVLPKMLSHDKELRIFGDPGFQILLRKAQIAAASSEREADYEILSDLLLHRAEQTGNRQRRLGIAKAIEVVDQIDELALIALSVVYAVSKYTPISQNLFEGLNTLDELFGKIFDGKSLPNDNSWTEHLSLLSAIRLSPEGIKSFKKLEEIVPNKLNEYFETGIKEDSEEYKRIKETFESSGLPLSCFEVHPLKEGYLHLTCPKDIQTLVITQTSPQGKIQIPLTTQQKEAMGFAIDINFKLNPKDNVMLRKFWDIWNQYPNLAILKKWWNYLTVHFHITPMGEALANAYIRGKEPMIPPIY